MNPKSYSHYCQRGRLQEGPLVMDVEVAHLVEQGQMQVAVRGLWVDHKVFRGFFRKINRTRCRTPEVPPRLQFMWCEQDTVGFNSFR